MLLGHSPTKVSAPPRALPMASAELSRRVEKVVGYPPLVDMDDRQRRKFHSALLEAGNFEDLPGKRWRRSPPERGLQAALGTPESGRTPKPNSKVVQPWICPGVGWLRGPHDGGNFAGRASRYARLPS
jgi:hypothetical protein